MIYWGDKKFHVPIFSDKFEGNDENDDFEDDTAEDITDNFCSVADDDDDDGHVLFELE